MRLPSRCLIVALALVASGCAQQGTPATGAAPLTSVDQCVPGAAAQFKRQAVLAPYADRMARATCECTIREVGARFTAAQLLVIQTDATQAGRVLGVTGLCLDEAVRKVLPT